MYKNLEQALIDLESIGELIRISDEVDPHLEMAEIHKQVFNKKGPAILFENVKGSPFRAVSNLYGTQKRVEFLFRDSIEPIKTIISLKADPFRLFKKPSQIFKVFKTLLHALPVKSFSKPVQWGETTIDQLPNIKCWPMDGGAFVLLPQVFAEDVTKPGWKNSNLGMYRVQLNGNEYASDEIGLHYQIHRGIGVLQKKAIEQNKALKVSIFVGGPPAHTFSAVMPLPEGMSELTFAGMLAQRNFRFNYRDKQFLSSDADFCIVGTIDPNNLKPEGPFGDHLGYYSLTHDFPVLKVEKVYHKKNAIWPFTVVQRPPAEDSYFGWLVHELTGDAIQNEIPGVKAVHAVDVSGVHPLLFAIGTERYTPYKEANRPTELLTQANGILGFGQCSLAKYLFIAEESKDLDIHNLDEFLLHILKRIDFKRDLHFITNTTIDTLDYSSEELNYGSKVTFAAAGKECFELRSNSVEFYKENLDYIKDLKLYKNGIVVFETKNEIELIDSETINLHRQKVRTELESVIGDSSIRMYVEVSDINEIQNESDFFWVTFTRSDPARDIYGTHEEVINKHYACESIIIDSTVKRHHAPALKADEKIQEKISTYLKEIGL
jgi:4-hydroxy-3-polyprenylbenzoate decarboxylase